VSPRSSNGCVGFAAARLGGGFLFYRERNTKFKTKSLARRIATKTQRVTLYLLQEGKCAICGKDLGDSFEVDHIQPFSQRGITEIWNLQALHKHCHSQKTFDQSSAR
jgi:5-methylcytosine-specific restriction endonuclease McrA